MTVFLTSDGKPFFGGTYYPKPGFLQLLSAIDDAWNNRRPELLDQAGQLTESLNRLAKLEGRLAYGFRNPANQRRRVRIACTRGTRRPSRTATARRIRQVTGQKPHPG